MKLVIAIISNDDAPNVSVALTKESYSVTKLATTGGFLKAGNTTLLVGCEDQLVEKAIDIIKEFSQTRNEMIPSTASYDMGRFECFPVEVKVGGATIFVIDIEKFIKI